jgi:hypothetical protein
MIESSSLALCTTILCPDADFSVYYTTYGQIIHKKESCLSLSRKRLLNGVCLSLSLDVGLVGALVHQALEVSIRQSHLHEPSFLDRGLVDNTGGIV